MPLSTPRDTPRLLWLTGRRALYRGPYVATSARCLGAWIVFVAPSADLRVRLGDGDWQTARVAVVPPYLRHQVVSEDRRTVSLHLEPESVDAAALPAWMRAGAGTVQADAFADGVLACWDDAAVSGRAPGLAAVGTARAVDDAAFDRLVFGAPLPRRVLDPRVVAVLAALDDDPASPDRAIDHARRCGLSTSRFVHLFKAETGVAFKPMRAWKRARAAIGRADWDGNLAHLAMATGYPDAAHFSRSMRSAYGLTPTGIRASARGLRRLASPEA